MSELFDRIRAAQPEFLVLSDDEFYQLDAWWQVNRRRQVNFSEMVRARSDPALAAKLEAADEWRKHLRITLEYNRNRRNGLAGPGSSPPALPAHAVAKTRPRRGRRADTNVDQDRRIAEAWNTNQYGTYADLERALGLQAGDAKLALDRHRKRTSRQR